MHRKDEFEEMIKLFTNEWNCNVKIVQKDIYCRTNFKSARMMDEDLSTEMLFINAAEVFSLKLNDDNINYEITENPEFQDGFQRFCTRIIDKDFKLFMQQMEQDSWLDQFRYEQHGTGVTALFWVFYMVWKNKDVNNIVIDNLDGMLHPNSRVALVNQLKQALDRRFIMLMNQDDLFSTVYTEIEDMYVMRDDGIKQVQECTDRELRISHNFRNLLRAGEFDL